MAYPRVAIETFLRREALHYAPDAWYEPERVKNGCGVNYNRGSWEGY
jgi:type I restriction enzyme M protein